MQENHFDQPNDHVGHNGQQSEHADPNPEPDAPASEHRISSVFDGWSKPLFEMTREELEDAAHNLFGELAGLLRKSAKKAAEIGAVLIALKEKVRAAALKWQQYVRSKFRISEDTAENYMAAARQWDQIEPLWRENPGLRLTAALAAVKRLNGPGPKHRESEAAREVLAAATPDNEADAKLLGAIGRACGTDKARTGDEGAGTGAEPTPARTKCPKLLLSGEALDHFQEQVQALNVHFVSNDFTATVVAAVEFAHRTLVREGGSRAVYPAHR